MHNTRSSRPPSISRHIEPGNKEDAIKQAISGYRRGIYTSLSSAARAYGVPKSTVVARAAGRKSVQKKAAKQQALTPIQEKVLLDALTEAQSWGFPWTPHWIRQVAEELYGGKLGVCWVTRFVQRHDLSSIFLPPLDQLRAYNHDRSTLESFLNLMGDTEKKYGIRAAHKYNMDEKGVMLGQARRSRVILNLEQYTTKRNAHRIQPGNKELVSIIECVSASGLICRPLIVVKALHHNEKWVVLDSPNMPAEYNYATSPRG